MEAVFRGPILVNHRQVLELISLSLIGDSTSEIFQNQIVKTFSAYIFKYGDLDKASRRLL